jgi:hypothetical protein
MALDNRTVLVIQFALSLAAWTAIVFGLIRPRLGALDHRRALRWLIAPQMLRHVGMSLLADGVTSPGLSASFASSVATGDVITALLALATFVALGRPGRAGYVLAGATTIVGAADLLHNVARGMQVHAPDHLGSAWPVVAFLVPLMLVLHVAAAARLAHVARVGGEGGKIGGRGVDRA